MQRAIAQYGAPEIVNTDQGCQFTSAEFTQPCWPPSSGCRWTGRADASPTSSSSGCGARSNTRGSISRATARWSIPCPARDLFPLLQRMPAAHRPRGRYSARRLPRRRTGGPQPMTTPAEWSLPAASVFAAVLGSDQSACPANGNYILISRPSCPTNVVHLRVRPQRAALHMKPSPLLIIPWVTMFIVCMWCASVTYSVVASYRPRPTCGNEVDCPPKKLGTADKEPANSDTVCGDDCEDKSGEKSPWKDPIVWFTGGTVLVGLVQAGIYLAQWRMMRETTRRSLRAYVGIDTSGDRAPCDGLSGNDWILNLPIINVGQTPAYDLECRHGWKCFGGQNTPWPVPQTYLLEASTLPSKGTIMPDCPTPIRLHLTPSTDGLSFSEIWAKAGRGEMTIYFYGTLTYRDAFGERHYTNFCFRHQPERNGAVAVCDHHNDSN